MNNKKSLIKKVVICITLEIVIIGIYLFGMKWISMQIELYPNDFCWIFQVDSIEIIDGELLLDGFAFKVKSNAVGDNYEVILHELETEKNYFLKMSYLERKDVNDYFLCEYDYLHSGFKAKIKERKLDLMNRDYEVLLRLFGDEKAYRTGIYITEGKIVYANPNEFSPLEVTGTDLEEVINEGVLRVYRPDEGIYIYQYMGELYWITEPKYDFDVNNDSYVQWHLTTTQIQNLPTYRLENNWTFDNLGFWFIDAELVEFDTGKYRVAKKKIPTEYSILLLSTGKYEEEWIWAQEFRPFYDLN